VKSFSQPKGISSTLFTNSFITVANNFLADIQSRGSTRAIVDVLGNPGGLVCFSRLLSTILVPTWFPDSQQFTFRNGYVIPNNIRINSTLSKQLARVSMEIDNNPVTGNRITDTKCYVDNPVTIDRAGTPQPFTAFTTLNCNSLFSSSVRRGTFDPELLVLTGGLCASSCSQLISKLWVSGKARIVGIGGLKGTPMDSSSVAGGNVFDWTSLLTFFNSSNTVNGPQQLPTSASMSFNFRESFINNLVIPREFTRIEPDLRIDDWDFFTQSNFDRGSLYETLITSNVPKATVTQPNFFSNTDFVCYNSSAILKFSLLHFCFLFILFFLLF